MHAIPRTVVSIARALKGRNCVSAATLPQRHHAGAGSEAEEVDEEGEGDIHAADDAATPGTPLPADVEEAEHRVLRTVELLRRRTSQGGGIGVPPRAASAGPGTGGRRGTSASAPPGFVPWMGMTGGGGSHSLEGRGTTPPMEDDQDGMQEIPGLQG